MGNSRSQPCQPRRSLNCFYFINRTWRNKTRQISKQDANDHSDDNQSRPCSRCKNCDYQQDSLTFDSESEMAPNAEEEMLAVKSWGLQQEKERLRPPTYNAEDYAMALRRWGRRPVSNLHDSQGTLPSTTSSSSGYVSGSGEMTLRQFTSVSELLNKLRADLRLAFPSFVQEFASAPADGITLLLETLRGVQLLQNTPPSGQTGPRIGTRRAALDELGCVECLAACTERCADAARLLTQAQPGLLALAVCLTSSLNRSRVLALQLLTKVCQTPGGHAAVSEAVSTLRLRYGEGGRFRFLAGALLAPRAAIALRVAGISFLNAFLKSAPTSQTRLYIQAEACEAGLEPGILPEWLTDIEGRSEETLMDLLRKEIQKWSQNCVDVDALQKRLSRAEETCSILGNKVAQLQTQLDKLNLEKRNGYNLTERSGVKTHQRLSSNGEDEGISSSERSSTPEDLHRSRAIDPGNKLIDNEADITIDDVIEELRIIVKDAEEEDRQENAVRLKCSTTKLSINQDYSSVRLNANPKVVEQPKKPDGGLTIVIKGSEHEEAIVPAILYPQPPRRTPPCLSAMLVPRPDDFLEHPVAYSSPNNREDEDHDNDDEIETLGDGSDSLLSASRLKYTTKEPSGDGGARIYLDNGASASREAADEPRDRVTIRNFDGAMKNLQDVEHTRHLEVYRQFDPKERSRYKSEMEKRKFLRRSVSHDFLDGHESSLKRYSKVEGRIRKFESMNSFDSSSQNLSRSSQMSCRRRGNDSSRKIRRSESCHQVSHSRIDGSSQAGSDSGLHYDLEPTSRRRLRSDGPESLAKSLDRIDEGLDSLVDIVIGGSKHYSKEKNAKPLRFEQINMSKGHQRPTSDAKNLSNCLMTLEHSGVVYNSSVLKSDELYTDRGSRAFGKISNFSNDGSSSPAIISSFNCEKNPGKFFINDSGIFLPSSKPHEGLLGKNRFNAGKYSGNPTPRPDNIGLRRHSISATKRGKVTDILSGLY